jgi:hypothetical protein
MSYENGGSSKVVTPSVRFAAGFPMNGEAVPSCRFPVYGEAPPQAVKGLLEQSQLVLFPRCPPSVRFAASFPMNGEAVQVCRLGRTPPVERGVSALHFL